MKQNDLIEKIQSIPWYHSIEIAPGIITPGRIPHSYLKQLLRRIALPENLEGLSVLDIGAWDGFFSFEAERRGARRVVALDLHPPDRYGFAIARDLLGSHVEYIQGSVYDLSPEVHGEFDIVLFLGVLYHLRYPLLALDRIWTVTRGYLLLETHYLNPSLLLQRSGIPLSREFMDLLEQIPLFRFYRHDDLTPGDFSNWFAFNRKAIEDVLASAGFTPQFLDAWDDRIAFRAVKNPGIPEYLRQTYEGLTYIPRDDGKYYTVLPWRVEPKTVMNQNVPVNPDEIPALLDEIGRVHDENVTLKLRLRKLEKQLSHLKAVVESVTHGKDRALGVVQHVYERLQELCSGPRRRFWSKLFMRRWYQELSELSTELEYVIRTLSSESVDNSLPSSSSKGSPEP